MMSTSGKISSLRLQQQFNREEDKLVKSHTHLENCLKKICWKKIKNLHEVSGNCDKKDDMEHLEIYTFLVVFLFLMIFFLQMLSVLLF